MAPGVLRRLSAVAVSALTVTATTTIVSLAGLGSASASTVTDCPNKVPPSTHVDSNLMAALSVSGNTVTYTFGSVNENPTGGVPGLIEYCVFTSPMPDTATVDPNLTGKDGEHWIDSGNGSTYFSFKRPSGNKSNIPFNGKTGIVMGTATWNAGVPATQTFLLHINDSSFCAQFSSSGAATCYVFPVSS